MVVCQDGSTPLELVTCLHVYSHLSESHTINSLSLLILSDHEPSASACHMSSILTDSSLQILVVGKELASADPCESGITRTRQNYVFKQLDHAQQGAAIQTKGWHPTATIEPDIQRRRSNQRGLASYCHNQT